MTKKSNGTTELKERKKQDEKLVFLLEESIPVESNARKKYAAEIALFYNSVFEKKLKHFIGEQLVELALVGNTELMSNILRSNINCFRLIDTWMKKMTNEHLGNLEEMRNGFTGDELTNKIKETYL